ncbi:hypothetical protein EYR40_011002 [Pleurotus pulmonarius]|nr:hypothetical protein EYR36_002769 [Pleurotus pulmonarius]KAF4586984.1 hypothetical protein EYR40_011002 [Pleurotus pulmonarius]
MSNLDPAWRPTGDLFSEKTWYIGTILVALSYGIILILCILCFASLYASIRQSNRRQRGILLVYVVLTFIAASLYLAGTTWMTQLSFIDYRLYPGGPARFEVDFFSQPVDAMANIAAAFANWLSEGLMCWRCIVIYSDGDRFLWLKKGIPLVLYLSELVLGTLWMIQVSRPSSSLWTPSTIGSVNFTTPYLVLSFSLNVLSTLAIAGRLLYYRSRLTRVLGKDGGKRYIGMVAMVVESAALFCGLVIMVFVTYVMDHPLQNTFFQLFGIAQMIPSLMIVHRVAAGKAWTNDHTTQVFSTISFSTGATYGDHRVTTIDMDVRRTSTARHDADRDAELGAVEPDVEDKREPI